MKIKLSKYWWGNLYIMLVQWIIMELILLYFLIDSFYEDKIIFGTLMIVWSFLSIYAALSPPIVFFCTIEIQGYLVKSFLFGKLKCQVSLTERVYYVIFNSKESMFRNKTYIAISNKPFEFKVETKGCTFLGYYDKRNQIVVPYNDETKYLFPVEKWININ